MRINGFKVVSEMLKDGKGAIIQKESYTDDEKVAMAWFENRVKMINEGVGMACYKHRVYVKIEDEGDDGGYWMKLREELTNWREML